MNEEDEIIRLVSLMSNDYLNGCIEFRIVIGLMGNQVKDTGIYAVNEMLHHAFYNLNLRRVELTVIGNNERAHRLYKSMDL